MNGADGRHARRLGPVSHQVSAMVFVGQGSGKLYPPFEAVVALLCAGGLLLGPGAGRLDAAASPSRKRIFSYEQADEARLLAQQECKPLVIHFVPDSEVGAKQLDSYYSGTHRVPDDILEGVVIVVVPSERFAKFKQDLGVQGAGGYRTISAYDLSPFGPKSTPTCRSGFR